MEGGFVWGIRKRIQPRFLYSGGAWLINYYLEKCTMSQSRFVMGKWQLPNWVINSHKMEMYRLGCYSLLVHKSRWNFRKTKNFFNFKWQYFGVFSKHHRSFQVPIGARRSTSGNIRCHIFISCHYLRAWRVFRRSMCVGSGCHGTRQMLIPVCSARW